ncbi:MAG: DNA polymerase III subunit delta [Bacillota bacterium]
MNQTELFKQVKKGEIGPVYAFLGEETWLKRRALSMLRDTLMPKELEPLNYDFPERQMTFGELAAACDTLPFMCEKRLVVAVCDTIFQKEAAQLAEYIKTLPPTCCLVFWAEEEKIKLPKELETLVKVVVFEPMDEALMAKFLCQEAKKADVELPVKLAAQLCRMAGMDIARALNELEKLCGYVQAGNGLNADALRRVATPVAEYNVFAMIDLFFQGKTAEGMRLLCAMLDEGEAPLALCSLLAARFRAMLRAKAMLSAGASAELVVRSLGGSVYAARKAVNGCRHLTYAFLRSAGEILLECDIRIKSGQMPARTALEYAVAKIFAE